MSDSDFFSRFRANTLKSMVKWILHPRTNTRIASTLQKYVPMDKNNLTESQGRKLTNAVKLQLIEIDKLSTNQRQLMRQIVENANNLTNPVFIRNVCNANKGGLHLKKSHHDPSVPNTHHHFTSTPLHQSYAETEQMLKTLSQRMAANAQKLATLNELSATMTIPLSGKEKIVNALAQHKKEEVGWKFRAQILSSVMHKIKKKEEKLRQHKKTMSLQRMMEKITVNQNKSLCQLTLNLNAMNMECDRIKQELMILCVDTNTEHMDKIHALQTQMKTKEKEKEIVSAKISTQNVVIQGIGLLLNEVINQQQIDIQLWSNLQINTDSTLPTVPPPTQSTLPPTPFVKETRLITHKHKHKHNHASSSILRLPVINNGGGASAHVNPVLSNQESKKSTKRKFKRPTRSNVLKAKRLSISDVLPQNLCPIQLSSNFMENGLIRTGSNPSESMFCPDTEARNEWIDGYNTRVIPAIQKKYRLIYGQSIYFKPMMKHKIKPHTAVINTSNPQNTQMDVEDADERSEDGMMSDDCINVSGDDTVSPPAHSHGLLLPNIDDKKKMKYRGKRNGQKRMMDKSHPLFVNDPLNRMESMNIENETFGDGLCLHYVARGMCRYADNGCMYQHPPKYDAKRFYCIQMRAKGECTRGEDCKYAHSLKDLPCRADCRHSDCLRNHTVSDAEYKEWSDAYTNRQIAFQKWKNINPKRYGKRDVVVDYTMNQSVVNDDRLHNVAIAEGLLFDSALTE